jgi:putative DNA primase/helicase
MSRRDVVHLMQAAPVVAPLVVRRAADINPQPVLWLWPGRIARGKVTMLAGHPGLGKSQLALGIAAIVTSGGLWPVDRARAERASAIILSADDDPADTIRPRLEASGAGLERCHIIEATQDIGGDGRPQRRGFSLVDDLARLDAELRRLDDASLIIIDPITAYLGAVDSHRNAEVRRLLAPLAELAAQRRVAEASHR